MKKINIPEAFDRVGEPWSPHIAARLNGQELRIAKMLGAFDWHRHENEDEAFFVIGGGFTMRFRDAERSWEIAMQEGDLIVVPAGVEHQPFAEKECRVMLFEPAGVLNTGDKQTPRTKTDLPTL